MIIFTFGFTTRVILCRTQIGVSDEKDDLIDRFEKGEFQMQTPPT
jgi:hypothetical protein